MSIHIEGRRWFRRRAGNSYSTARVFKDGKHVATLGPDCCYGDHYLELAFRWLEKNGHPELAGVDGGTLNCRETLGASYSVIDVPREKDL